MCHSKLINNSRGKNKSNTCLMRVFICDKDTLAIFDKFRHGFYSSHTEVNLQNFNVNELTKWFVFEAVQ